jgi:hypothetical protein
MYESSTGNMNCDRAAGNRLKRFFAVSSYFASVLVLCLTGIACLADEAASALKQDDSLRQALQQNNKSAVGSLLDKSFMWTNSDGKTRNRSETLTDLSSFASANGEYDDVKGNGYQHLAFTYGKKADVRFVRIWVKRGGGWRLYLDLDTPISSQPPKMPVPSTGDCLNPCRELPYKAKTTDEKALLDEWQKTKVDEWHPNAADWGTHIGDEFMIINSTSARNKTERVAFAEQLQAAGISMPGDPIMTMRLERFGDATLMVTQHSPYHGGKPYYNIRVFVKRDGHWPLVWSQQTTIRDAADVPAADNEAAPKKD